jgi:proton-dependent oligopeptide transporter, POT family
LKKEQRSSKRILGITSIVLLVLCLRVLMQHSELCNWIIKIIGAAMLMLILVLAMRQPTTAERNKMFGYVMLAIASLIFWVLYQMAPMGLQLFSERNVDRHVFGILVAPQWIQNINTLVIIFGGPLFSVIFTQLRERGININIPLQFSLALLMIGAGFAILPLGISMADAQGYTSFSWIFMSYVLQSLGELFISPIGYAMVGQLAPLRLRGLMMGMWMMVTGIAAIFSGVFSKMALGTTDSIHPLVSNASYSHTFGLLGWSSIAAGIVLFALIPAITRLTQEKKTNQFASVLNMSEAR